MKKILLSAASPDEKKIAVLSDGILSDYVSYMPGMEDRRNSIYRGIVDKVSASLDACFVKIGDAKNGFLQSNEIDASYLEGSPDQPLNERIKPGTPLVVQIIKDERAEKGTLLTTRIKIMGHWLVLEAKPRKTTGMHISRMATSEERAAITAISDSLVLPPGMNLIVRTAGLDAAPAELVWEFNSYLLKLWGKIKEVAGQMEGTGLIYHDMDIVNRCVREYFTPAVVDLACDAEQTADEVRQIFSAIMPDMVDRVRTVPKDATLFDERMLGQIDALLAREVRLPSGGSIVIDQTEALVAIDVNSSRTRGQSGIEDTASQTNREAATEIARQLRLRNLSGLIAIDFIDMDDGSNRSNLLNHFARALRSDSAQVQMGSLSEFGILEMTRQNIGRALHETHSAVCDRCGGTGRRPTARSFALNQLDKIRDLCIKRRPLAMVTVEMAIEPATYLLNEHRAELRKIEQDFDIDIVILPSRRLEMPQANLRVDKVSKLRSGTLSYEQEAASSIQDDSYREESGTGRSMAAAAISSFVPDRTDVAAAAPPASKPAAGNSLFGRLLGLFKSGSDAEQQQPAPTAARDREPRQLQQPRRPSGSRSRRSSAARQGAATPSANGDKPPSKRSRSRRRKSGSKSSAAAGEAASAAAQGQPGAPADPSASARQEAKPDAQAKPAQAAGSEAAGRPAKEDSSVRQQPDRQASRAGKPDRADQRSQSQGQPAAQERQAAKHTANPQPASASQDQGKPTSPDKLDTKESASPQADAQAAKKPSAPKAGSPASSATEQKDADGSSQLKRDHAPDKQPAQQQAAGSAHSDAAAPAGEAAAARPRRVRRTTRRAAQPSLPANNPPPPASNPPPPAETGSDA